MVIDNVIGNSESIDVSTVSLLYIPISLDPATHSVKTPCDISGLTGVDINYIEVGEELYAYIAIEHGTALAAGDPITIGNFDCVYYEGDWEVFHLSVATASKVSHYTSKVDSA